MRGIILGLYLIFSVGYAQLRIDGSIIHFTQVNDQPKFRSNMFAHVNTYYSFKLGLNLGYGVGYNNFYFDKYYPAIHHGPSVLYNANIKGKYALCVWMQANWVHFLHDRQPLIDPKIPAIFAGMGYPITFMNNSFFLLTPMVGYLYFNNNHYLSTGIRFSFKKQFR